MSDFSMICSEVIFAKFTICTLFGMSDINLSTFTCMCIFVNGNPLVLSLMLSDQLCLYYVIN